MTGETLMARIASASKSGPFRGFFAMSDLPFVRANSPRLAEFPRLSLSPHPPAQRC